MKIAIIVCAAVATAAVCTIAGCRMFSKRSTDATIPLTAKLPGKAAVVCYSQSKVHNTATVAQWIAKHAGATLFVLEMAEPYPEPYFSTLKAAYKDFKAGTLPALKDIPDLDGYDVVFLGSPIWYGTYAMPVGTFLKANPLAGKTVAPFCTHGGGGAGRFAADLQKACPGAKLLEPLVIRGSNQIERRMGLGVSAHHTEDDVVEWLNRLF
ncbi:MAG: NAD(P)H-dependent oxidoreductase [Kiritimatiellae bacterium]|nr:NAD(P)H-dependent oxidoreductase [Kiritimatiellia bacterium]